MELELGKSQNQPNMYAVTDLRLGASKMNHVAYLRYKSCQLRPLDYFIRKIVDATTNEVVMCMQSEKD